MPKDIWKVKDEPHIMLMGIEHSKSIDSVQKGCHETIQDHDSAYDLTKFVPEHALKIDTDVMTI